MTSIGLLYCILRPYEVPVEEKGVYDVSLNTYL